MSEKPALQARLESSELSCEGLQITRLSGREAISRPFSFEIDLVRRVERSLPAGLAPGARLSIVFEEAGHEVRRVTGVVMALRDRLETRGTRRTCSVRLAPRASLLELVETQEIYLDLSVPEILTQKLERYGFSREDVELRLLGEYPRREIVAQYKETDLAFLSRLTEHAGISYLLEEGGPRGRLVFTDHRAGFRPVEGAEQVRYRDRGEARDVFLLEVERQLIPSTFAVQDYNYRHPQVDLTATFRLDAGFAGGVVEYGAHVKTPEEAEALARIRAEERDAQGEILEGRSTLCSLSAGRTSTLEGHPHLDALELLFVEVEHEGRWPAFDEAGSEEASYESSFKAIPAAKTYRPPRRTPRPRIHGLVTGVVQPGRGAALGSQACLDEHGRYTVQFHFDTAPTSAARASHPVRMAQPYAGPGHGMHFPLRPGAEVVIAFVDGDPDRPVIVGAVPNAITPSPVVASTANTHRISTAAGVLVEISERR